MKIIFVKKGMATKAFLKYCKEGNTKQIQRQILKGLVTKIKTSTDAKQA